MEEKLIEAVRGGLERDGILGKLRSEIRCEVLRLLGIHDLKKVSKPIITPEVNVINSLVGEYLQWIGYSFTSAIFSSGHCVKGNIFVEHTKLNLVLRYRIMKESDFTFSKDDTFHARITNELGLKDCTDDSLPLLCQLINKVKQNCNY